jgi:hypothetical protein
MKRVLRIVAVLIVLAAAGFWLAAGANRGLTVNNRPQTIVDPVTGLEGTAYEKVFIPGWDFLGVALVAAGIMTGASFLFRKKTGTESNAQPSHQPHQL